MASAEVVDCAYNLAGGVSVYQRRTYNGTFATSMSQLSTLWWHQAPLKPQADCSLVCLPTPQHFESTRTNWNPAAIHFYRGAGNELIASNEDNCLGYFVSGTRARD